jgi:hypothetical protein
MEPLLFSNLKYKLSIIITVMYSLLHEINKLDMAMIGRN